MRYGLNGHPDPRRSPEDEMIGCTLLFVLVLATLIGITLGWWVGARS